jgi:hypothetical protein
MRMRLLLCQTLLGLLFIARPVLAQQYQFTFSPFALYEQSAKSIVIDGVSTKYGLGVLGAEIKTNISDQFQLSGKIGYGQNNDQAVSFSGANFKGVVRGSYLEAAGRYAFYSFEKFEFFGDVKFINRTLHASDLTGTRNGLSLTGKADTTIRTSDALLGFRYALSDTTSIKFAAGYHQWHLIADATGYYASNGITATARKKIDTIGIDPVFDVSIEDTQANRTIVAKIASRSLHSEANTEILTAELIYQLSF